MEAFFRGIAIGLGVLMGTFQQGVEPELLLSVHKTGALVLLSGNILRAVSPTMEDALGEGVLMALTLQTAMDGRQAAGVTQTLEYRSLNREWVVSGPGEARRSFTSRAEAEKAWVSWKDVPAGTPVPGPFTVTAQATLSFPGRPEWKADMVWKPTEVSWKKTFSRLSEIPF